jgi:hypothetical protein
MRNLVNELGCNLRTGKREPGYRGFHISFDDQYGADGDVFYAKNQAAAERKCLRRNPGAVIVLVEELGEE